MILGAVLAAGMGRRFGGPKALARRGDIRWVDATVDLLRTHVDEVVVITGAWTGEVPGTTIQYNPRWETGLASSVASALEHAIEREATALLIVPVDLEGLNDSHVERVLSSAGELAYATSAGRQGHPVLIRATHFRRLQLWLEQSPSRDRGAAEYLIANHAEAVEIGSLSDLDRPRAMYREVHGNS